jgi:hypothetical protein
MFCPQCRTEYVEGVKECADCRVPLVKERPPEEPFTQPDFEKILTTYNIADIAVIKSVLDSAGIHYVFDGENFNMLEQMVQPARLFVRADDVEAAKELLKDLTIKYVSISPRDPSGDETGEKQ